MTRTRIYLTRHGQVEGHEEKRYNGQGEVELTAQGFAQMGLLQMRLQSKDISAVYSSDLGRCREGAQLIAQPHDLRPVLREDLRELHIGHWEGKTWKELQSLYPAEWQARLDDIVHYQVPGGENLLAMAMRVRTALAEIVAAHPGEDVVVVGHGGVNRVILLDAIGAPLDRLFHLEHDFGSLNIIDHKDDVSSVVKLMNG
jgi:alpha-ribazole phosphatase/probable phosphoglycerate mutase